MTIELCKFGCELGPTDYFEDGVTRPYVVEDGDADPEVTSGPYCLPHFRLKVGLAPVPQPPPVEVCRLQTRATEIIGAPCPACRHTNLLHRNYGNPDLEACLVCELQATIAAASS